MSIANKPEAAGKYDFSAVYLVHQDMKKHFRNYAMLESRLLKQLEKNHNKFFQTILQNRRQLYFGKALEQATEGEGGFGDLSGGLAKRMKPQQPRKFYSVAPTPGANNRNLSPEQEDSVTKKRPKPSASFVVEDDHGGNIDGVDYDNFNYIDVLKWEMEKEKENMVSVTLDQDETEAERYIKQQEMREREIKATVELLANNRKALLDMPQMEFRRILLQDDILSELSKTILDTIYKNEKSRG